MAVCVTKLSKYFTVSLNANITLQSGHGEHHDKLTKTQNSRLGAQTISKYYRSLWMGWDCVIPRQIDVFFFCLTLFQYSLKLARTWPKVLVFFYFFFFFIFIFSIFARFSVRITVRFNPKLNPNPKPLGPCTSLNGVWSFWVCLNHSDGYAGVMVSLELAYPGSEHQEQASSHL